MTTMPKMAKMNSQRLCRISRALALVGVGVFLAVMTQAIHRKSQLMDGPSPSTRLVQLADVSRSIGVAHFSTCKSKVQRLHSSLSGASACEEDAIPKLIASIIIDGKNCNSLLMENLDSRVSLPRIYMYPQFRMANINGPNIGVGLKDEQGLILWVLSRINHDRLIPAPNLCSVYESPTEESSRSFLIEQWRYELRE